MLFNSYEFIFGYLPLTFLGFFLLARVSHFLAASWLTLASVFFYGWWSPAYIGLLLGSILFNFIAGMSIGRAAARGETRLAGFLLAAGVGGDLLLLGYYKYADFFLANYNALAGADLALPGIVLPLGISFFTFTQIAFLVDTWQGKVREYRFVHYALFVTYFPHLIAGPVLHHKEMMPQFGHAATYRMHWENVAVGLTIFFIGLFKKTVLADGIAQYVGPVFSAHDSGARLPLLDAWGGALAYTFQLYFDFSGYSDMAIGLSLLFGVRLPLNFHSPYKAENVIEFWRRWHMTLSRFLRDYLYIPLGGNRRGSARRYLNLMVTMLLGGLWHGANWSFVVWGGLHGLYLMANHAWHTLKQRLGYGGAGPWGRWTGRVLTFLAVVVAWVFFRAESLDAALHVLQGMAGLNGVVFPYRWLEKLGAAGQWLAARGVEFQNLPTFKGGGQINFILVSLIVVWAMPNTQQILGAFRPALNLPQDVAQAAGRPWQWRPTRAWLAAGIAAAVIAMLNISELSEFIYFQF
jgi:D-alanyl-lipoteichoic acid acyltransferase DltB (MBOAT superfamily)